MATNRKQGTGPINPGVSAADKPQKRASSATKSRSKASAATAICAEKVSRRNAAAATAKSSRRATVRAPRPAAALAVRKPSAKSLVALTLKVDSRSYEQLSLLRLQQHRSVQEILSEALGEYLADAGFEGDSRFESETGYESESGYERGDDVRRKAGSEALFQREDGLKSEASEADADYENHVRGTQAATVAGWTLTPAHLWKLLTAVTFLLFFGYSVRTVEQLSGNALPLWKAAAAVAVVFGGIVTVAVLYRARGGRR